MTRKTIVPLLFALILCLPGVQAQKSSKNNTITPAERAASVQFADGLKYFYSSNYKDAEQKFRNVIAQNPGNAAAHYMLAQIEVTRKNYPAAEHYLNNATKADKSNVWYQSALAEVLDLQGDYARSEKLWLKACNMDSRNEQYLLCYAQSLLNQGKVVETIKAFDRIERVVGATEEITGAKVEMWLHINNVKGAVGEYDKLIKAEPGNEGHYLNAASIYIANDYIDKALPYLERAAAVNPKSGRVQLMLGNYHDAKGDRQAAFNAWLAAFESREVPVSDKMPILRKYLAALTQREATAEQIQLSEAMARTHPDVLEGWAALGSIAKSKRDYPNAARYFEKALAIDQAQFAIWQDYLYCLVKSDGYAKVVELESDIAELFPTNAMAMFSLGTSFAKTGQPAKAIPYFEKSLKYTYDKEGLRHIYDEMAAAYRALGDEAKAAECAKKGTQR